MIRAILALALVALLAGCDTTDSSSPSGAEAPRLTVTVLTGTKAAPVDSPTVKVAWEHEGRVSLHVRTAKNGNSSSDSSIVLLEQVANGSITTKFHCTDSLRVFVVASAKVDTGYSAKAADTSKTIYCK